MVVNVIGMKIGGKQGVTRRAVELLFDRGYGKVRERDDYKNAEVSQQ